MDAPELTRGPTKPVCRAPLKSKLTTIPSTSDNTQLSVNLDAETLIGEYSNEERRSDHQKALQRKLLPRDVSDKLEPFEAMPVQLDRFAEALVSFYLLQYPKATYVFNQNLNPHPVYTNFAIALNAPACFQVILARSALYKISAGQYGTILEKAELETAIVEHKTNAIRRIRHLSTKKTMDKDELVASIISLGTLDMRMGSTASGDVHYSAVRRLLKEIGGPMHIQDIRLKRVMCFFECIYGTVRNSYIWERSDFDGILERFNIFLADTWETWKARSTSPGLIAKLQSEFPFPRSTKTTPPIPLPGQWLTRMPSGAHSPYFGIQPQPKVLGVKTDVPEAPDSPERSKPNNLPSSVTANRSAKIVAKKDARLSVKERAKQIGKKKAKHTDTIPATPISQKSTDMPPLAIPVDTVMLQKDPHGTSDQLSYWKLSPESTLHRRLSLWDELPEEKRILALLWDLSCLFCLSAIIADHADKDVNILSTYMSKLSKIVHDANLHVSENNSNMMWLIQTNDSKDEHVRRIWEVAAFTWVCKHLNVNVQKRLREWLFAYLTGKELQRKITLTAFDFSYDRSMS